MPPFIEQFFEKFKKLETIYKIFIISAVVLFFSMVILFASFSNSKTFSPLYYNLTASQAGEVIQFLKKQRIPYKINEKTGLIEVPKSDIYEVRMTLAKSGLPGDNQVGLEIFDRTKLGQTEFVQNINYIRAIQGELSRSIESIRGIKHARVHIVIPKESLFIEDQTPATASIIITYEGGIRKLKKNQIRGIINLVASAVEGLKPENVKIIDSYGNVLTDLLKEENENITEETSKKLNFKKKIEKYYEKRIQSMLEKVVGKGKVIARVTADIDFTKSEKTVEMYDPEMIAERSHQILKESSEKYNPQKGGVPGVVTNVPSVAAQQNKKIINNNLKENHNKNQEIVNYEVSKTVSKTVNPVGIIKRMSVAVLVDGTYKTVKKGKKEVKKFVPRNSNEMNIFKEIVKKAIGFNQKRKDQIEVSCVEFSYNEAAVLAANIAKERRTELITIGIKYGLTIIMLLIIFIFIFRPFLKVIMQRVKPPEELVKMPKTIEALEQEVKSKKDRKGVSGTSATIEEISPQKKSPKDILVEIIEENPQEVAKIVQQWIRSK